MKNIDFLAPFHGQYAEVRVKEKRDLKYGLIDKTGAFVIPPIYDQMFYYGGDFVAVNIGYRNTMRYEYPGKWGVVNLKHEWIIPLKYSYMNPWQGGGTFSVCYRNRWGAINTAGEVIIKFTFDRLSIPDKYGWIDMEVGGKCGFIDVSGKQVISPIYDLVCYSSPFENVKAGEPCMGVCIGDDGFYIDITGKRVLL